MFKGSFFYHQNHLDEFENKFIITDMKWFADVLNLIMNEASNKDNEFESIKRVLCGENVQVWKYDTLKQKLGQLIQADKVFFYYLFYFESLPSL